MNFLMTFGVFVFVDSVIEFKGLKPNYSLDQGGPRGDALTIPHLVNSI